MTDSSSSLVSVGIPTYNRPAGLRRTLDYITAQTYQNLEIIVSDNASPDPEVENVAREFTNRDNRIRYYRQEENKGAGFNFKFVLQQAHGEYFMWAADDDKWENFYIDQLVVSLASLGKGFIAANLEAQYIDENGHPFEFFAEGKSFYAFDSEVRYKRLEQILRHNYGNLVYSLYRAEVLQKQNFIFVENEVPFLLQIIQHGNWKVLPSVGFYKKTTQPTYLQARWEMEGGYLNLDSAKQPLADKVRNFLYGFPYHKNALISILKSIDSLNLERNDRLRLQQLTRQLIWKHLLQVSVGYKRKPSP
jgi:glycosyltransferase involved in cell wall biosynthesis